MILLNNNFRSEEHLRNKIPFDDLVCMFSLSYYLLYAENSWL